MKKYVKLFEGFSSGSDPYETFDAIQSQYGGVYVVDCVIEGGPTERVCVAVAAGRDAAEKAKRMFINELSRRLRGQGIDLGSVCEITEIGSADELIDLMDMNLRELEIDDNPEDYVQELQHEGAIYMWNGSKLREIANSLKGSGMF